MKKSCSFTRNGNAGFSSFIKKDEKEEKKKENKKEKKNICPECGANMVKVLTAVGWGSDVKEQCPKCGPKFLGVTGRVGFGNI